MKKKELRDFQKEDLLPRNDLMSFRCNQKAHELSSEGSCSSVEI